MFRAFNASEFGRGRYKYRLHRLLGEQFIAPAEHEREAKESFPITIVDLPKRGFVAAGYGSRQTARLGVGPCHRRLQVRPFFGWQCQVANWKGHGAERNSHSFITNSTLLSFFGF